LSNIRAGTISGVNGTDPVTLTKQSAAKSWINFDGTGTIAARDSFNVASLTDNGTGTYTASFSNAMSSGNFAAYFNASPTNERPRSNCCSDFVTGSVALTTGFPSDTSGGITNNDESNCQMAAHGDLA
tara:strand:+ start:158 stop:541 length:384 start_codon:yes stop_codon:yes gene_type:complete